MLVSPKEGFSKIGDTLDFSLVLPVFNEEKNIQKCLENLNQVLDSTFQNHELILVNDGSTDNTLEIIKMLVLILFTM